MYFMPDKEVLCTTCKYKRYNAETLEVAYRDKTIVDILDASIEEGVLFFEDIPAIGDKIKTMNDLGLGYLTLANLPQPCPGVRRSESNWRQNSVNCGV
jgi:excinuclease ABC subunit A